MNGGANGLRATSTLESGRERERTALISAEPDAVPADEVSPVSSRARVSCPPVRTEQLLMEILQMEPLLGRAPGFKQNKGANFRLCLS